MSFKQITHELYQQVLENGSIEVTRQYLKEVLDDENDRINPKLGVSNRQYMMQLTGAYVPTKEEVWREWLAANEMQAEYNETKGTWTLTFIRKRKLHGAAKDDGEGSADGSGDDSGSQL